MVHTFVSCIHDFYFLMVSNNPTLDYNILLSYFEMMSVLLYAEFMLDIKQYSHLHLFLRSPTKNALPKEKFSRMCVPANHPLIKKKIVALHKVYK